MFNNPWLKLDNYGHVILYNQNMITNKNWTFLCIYVYIYIFIVCQEPIQFSCSKIDGGIELIVTLG